MKNENGKIIDSKEADRIIINEGLKLQDNVWHFTFNEEFQYRKYIFNKTKGLVYSKPINQWAPLLVYSNRNVLLPENNYVTTEIFDKNNKTYRKVFWYLNVNSFDLFLQRRSDSSSQPAKNFPSLQTYNKKKTLLKNSYLEVTDFDQEFYIYNFNLLNKESHLNATEIFTASVENTKGLPISWVKLACFYHENSLKSIMLLVDDSRSICFVNMATERSKYGYGLFLCTELVKYCAENNYKSFDSGVSGLYGNYKDKIFLDSREIYTINNESMLKYFEFWKKKFWKKVFTKTGNLIATER